MGSHAGGVDTLTLIDLGALGFPQPIDLAARRLLSSSRMAGC